MGSFLRALGHLASYKIGQLEIFFYLNQKYYNYKNKQTRIFCLFAFFFRLFYLCITEAVPTRHNMLLIKSFDYALILLITVFVLLY